MSECKSDRVVIVTMIETQWSLKMNDVIIAALLKSLKSPKVEAGDYSFDETFVVNIKGSLSKDEDESYTPTVDIPLLLTMALLLEKMGIVRDRAAEMLKEAMQEAIAHQQSGDEYISHFVNDIKVAMDRVREVTGSLPKKTRSGKTKVKAEVDIQKYTNK